VYHYGSSLETGSARFDRPGEFFIYLLFVAFTLMVSDLELYFLSFLFPSHYLPAQPSNLAEAVPGSEGDYPCIPCSTINSQNIGAACDVGMVGLPFEIAGVIL
jgi:Derlin-2/3